MSRSVRLTDKPLQHNSQYVVAFCIGSQIAIQCRTQKLQDTIFLDVKSHTLVIKFTRVISVMLPYLNLHNWLLFKLFFHLDPCIHVTVGSCPSHSIRLFTNIQDIMADPYRFVLANWTLHASHPLQMEKVIHICKPIT